MTELFGGSPAQGMPVGILMLDSVLPRIAGDVGNAMTYDFPVCYYTVKGARAKDLMEKHDPAMLSPFIEGAQALEKQGCGCIATCCGFLLDFQKQIQSSVNIPVITSGLLQVPLVASFIAPDKKIGILTSNAAALKPELYMGNVSPERVCIQDMRSSRYFFRTFPMNAPSYVYENIRDDVAQAVTELSEKCPDLGAVVCSGTNFAPYNGMICRMTKVPVFDIVTLIRFVASGVMRGMSSNFRNRPAGPVFGTNMYN